MEFDRSDEERAFWDDEPRRPRRRRAHGSEPSPARPTGSHPALSPRAAAIASARSGRAGTRRHGDPTGAVPVVHTAPPTDPPSLSDIWDDDWDRPAARDTVGPRGQHLPDVWDGPVEISPIPARPSRSRRDVARLRLGLLTAASVVLVPVAFALDGGGGDGLRTSTPAAAVALPDGGLVTSAPAATVAPTIADDATAFAAGDVASDPSGSDVAGTPASTAASDTDASDTDAPATTAASATEVTTVPPTEAASTEAPSTSPSTAAPTDPPTTEVPITEAPSTTVDRAAAHAAAVAACGNTYEIAAGDYWIGIADAIDTPLADLLELNAATVDTPLYAGREVCLPAGAHIAEPTTTAATTTTAAPTTTAKPTSTTAPKTTTTTAAPATTSPKTTTTTEAPPKNTYTRAEVEAIIREVWPDDLEDEAVRIATRESNLIPTVRNYCCYGLFQIYYSVHKTWLAQMGVTSASQLYDPRVNATAAYALYQRSGSWAPWAL